MRLPKTTRTPLGFTVEGAGAELLEDLLKQYEFELGRQSPAIVDAMQPGLPAAQIEDEIGALGLTPPREAIVWWRWRNGFRPMVRHGLKHAQLRFEDSIKFYRRATLGTAVEEWNPNWLRIAGGGNEGDAISCAEMAAAPLVRSVSTFDLGTQDDEEPLRQVVSLCTPVTWWLLAIAKGWDYWNPITGLWSWDDEQYPLEWKLTNLM
jgi:hypothetical protein